MRHPAEGRRAGAGPRGSRLRHRRGCSMRVSSHRAGTVGSSMRGAATTRIDPLEDDTRSLLPFVFGRLMDAGLDTDIVQKAKAAYLETSWQNLARVARLLVVLRRFEEAGIPAVLLKGAALALRYYRNFGMRSMADIDLLVHPADVRRAATLLADLGWTASGVARGDRWPRRCACSTPGPSRPRPCTASICTGRSTSGRQRSTRCSGRLAKPSRWSRPRCGH